MDTSRSASADAAAPHPWHIVAPVRAALDELMHDALERTGAGLVGPITRAAGAGKRMRPALTIAAAGEPGCSVAAPGAVIAPVTLAGAAAVELLHWATLVHDDVIDDAGSRHGQLTMNAREGLGSAIVAGDLLIGASFGLAAPLGAPAVTCLARTLTTLCQGQTLEERFRWDADTDEDDAVAVSAGKTGSLTAAAAHIGGLCGGVEANLLEALSEFGAAFGISFQIMDDLLDVTSSTQLLGKPVAADFVAGTVTVPAVAAMRVHPELRELLRPGLSAEERARALQLLRTPDALDHGLCQARHWADTAAATLLRVAADDEALTQLAAWPQRYLQAMLESRMQPAFAAQLGGTSGAWRVAV